ncbi:MAG: hypothetical protein KJ011_01785 [Burkholderiaceae bacterium]|nr:hypothetical protein [Burkholderiaceae bacterium]
MTAPNHVDETLAGERSAETFLHLLRTGYAAPDALAVQIEAARLRSDARLRGFCQLVQKRLEAGGADAR